MVLTGKFRNIDTPFLIDSSYENELLAALPLTGDSLHKTETEYHGKLGHTIGRIHHIYIMSITDICYTTYCLATQTVAPTIPGFQGIKQCIQYLSSHQHKPIFILLIIMMDQMSSGLHGLGFKLKTTQQKTS